MNYDALINRYVTSSAHRLSENINDIWTKTLERKGSTFFTLDEVLNMKMPGCRTNAHTLNSWSVADEESVDNCTEVTSSIFQKIIEGGEPDYNSRKDCTFKGKTYSSLFFKDAIVASKIVSRWESLKKTPAPSILEIGGGIGGLAQILRTYFGSRCKSYLIDLPSNLFLQERFLRNEFPDIKVISILNPSELDLLEDPEPRLIFISANMFHLVQGVSPKINFDICINVNSMQEMSKTTICAYFDFIHKKIRPGGIFYLKNRFGHGEGSISEVYNYPFDNNWKLIHKKLVFQHENVGFSEFIEIILLRSNHSTNNQLKELIKPILKDYPLTVSYPDKEERGESITANSISNFIENTRKSILRSIHAEYKPTSIPQLVPSNQGSSDELNGFLNLLKVCRIVKLLDGNKPLGDPKRILEEYMECSSHLITSDYWKVKVLSYGYCLEVESSLVSKMLNSYSRTVKTSRGLLRMCLLAKEYDFHSGKRLVEQAIEMKNLMDPWCRITLLKAADGYFSIDEIRSFLREIRVSDLGIPQISYLLESLSEINFYTDAWSIWREYRKNYSKDHFYLLKGFVSNIVAVNDGSESSIVNKLKLDIAECLERMHKSSNEIFTSNDMIMKFFMKKLLGVETSSFFTSQDYSSADYYQCATLASLMVQDGYGEEAFDCAMRSMRLRSNNYQHSIFLADTFFSNKMPRYAKYFYEVASHIINYLLYPVGKFAICHQLTYKKKSHISHPKLYREAGFLFSDDQACFKDSARWK